jgi:chemotaxis signal transduction protein
VEEIQIVEEKMIHDVPPIIGKGDLSYMNRIIDNGTDLIIVIDTEGLLTEDELKSVDNMVKSHS